MGLMIPQIEKVKADDPILYEALKRLNAGINMTAANAGVSATTAVSTPPTIQQLIISAAGGVVDALIVDQTAITGGLSYFIEASTDIGFTKPYVFPLGPTRNMRVTLGGLSLYFRCYSQYPTSDRSPYVYWGSPTLVVLGGAAGPPQNPPGGGGWPSCTEVGTPLEFFAGATPQIVVVPEHRWVDIQLENGNRVSAVPGTLVACWIPVQDLSRVRKLLGKVRVSTGHGNFSKLKKWKRRREKSQKMWVKEPVNQRYLGGGIEVHNRKAAPEET